MFRKPLSGGLDLCTVIEEVVGVPVDDMDRRRVGLRRISGGGGLTSQDSKDQDEACHGDLELG